MKILAGVYQPNAGEVLIDGQTVGFARPADALARGIAMIYQELSLAPHLSVAENIFLGREPLRLARLGVINGREMNERASHILSECGFKIDPRAPVVRLSPADRQMVEIARASVEAKRVIVMDEPTSSLTTHEVDELFRLIGDLKKRGLAIIYISHRLEELDSTADRLTILRDGQRVYTGAWGEISAGETIWHMAGRELKEVFPPRRAEIGVIVSGGIDLSVGSVMALAGVAGGGDHGRRHARDLGHRGLYGGGGGVRPGEWGGGRRAQDPSFYRHAEAVSQVLEEQRTYDVIVRFDDSARQSVESLGRTLIDTPAGSKVPIGQVADVRVD